MSASTVVKQKRALLESEILDILSELTPTVTIPSVVAESHIENIRARVRSQLEKVMVFPEIVPSLKSEILRQYNIARIQPGESVGIMTAQSIGERQTQMTLDTFHSAGAALKTVITGVPRFSELLSATKNPKTVSATVFPVNKYSSVADIRCKLGTKLKNVLLSDLVSKADIGSDIGEWYHAYEMIWGTRHHEHEHFVALVFDVQSLFDNKIELDAVAKKIETVYTDLVCVPSPTFLGQIDVYIDVSNVESNLVAEYMLNVVIPKLMELSVSGITGITDVFYDKKDGEWYVETAGSNLVELFNNKAIDFARTVSNDMWEIFNVLGVEAAREFLINEFTDTISSDGTYVNKCHTQLLVDTMLFSGNIISVSRYGQRKSKCGPLAKASFEESLDNFIKAATSGENESTTSISSSIMLGKLPNCGTGVFDVHVDIAKLIGSAPIQETSEEYDDDEVYQL